MYGKPGAIEAERAADALQRWLGAQYRGDDWKKIERQLGDGLSRLRRDALAGWLVANSPEAFVDMRDLSDFLLTDVEVDAILDTSSIVEASAALQLHFHRYLANL